MVISDQHRYLFVELPHTGSSAMSRELRESYGGRPVHNKHATYRRFLRSATPRQRRYFVFSTIRNPLDEAVTKYFKFRKAAHIGRDVPLVGERVAARVHSGDLDFPAFLRRRYRLPYANWSILAHRDFDYVMRYETLEEDFSRVLERLGLEKRRKLPVANKTPGRDRDFEGYYPPEIRDRAKRIFGPFMASWGYPLPASWGGLEVSRRSQAYYELLNVVRRPYWEIVMNRTSSAPILKKLRSALLR